MILSVSRRTDIPAFYSDWFFKQLEKGFVLVPNPINPVNVAKIKLEPLKIKSIETNLLGEKKVETEGNIEGLVFWTKNPAPMLNQIEKLKDFSYYFLYTLNAYPQNIEGNLPPLEERIKSFQELSKFCPVIWRYDPILIADGIDENWHIEKFKMLCENLRGYTHHCKISFLIRTYSGCAKNLHTPSIDQQNKMLEQFSRIAKENEIQIEACAESGDWQKFGIVPSKCIDGEVFEKLLTEKYKDKHIIVTRKNNKIDGQRKFCGCMPSVDIGRYDTCKHNCTYCYARKAKPTTMLVEPDGEIYDRKTELEFEYK